MSLNSLTVLQLSSTLRLIYKDFIAGICACEADEWLEFLITKHKVKI